MADPWEFLETWAKENVHGILFGDEETARQLAKSCLEAAKKTGISEAAITKAAGGSLSDFLLSELETAANAEERRLAEKDRRLMPRGPKGG
jgi:urate oxidase